MWHYQRRRCQTFQHQRRQHSSEQHHSFPTNQLRIILLRLKSGIKSINQKHAKTSTTKTKKSISFKNGVIDIALQNHRGRTINVYTNMPCGNKNVRTKPRINGRRSSRFQLKLDGSKTDNNYTVSKMFTSNLLHCRHRDAVVDEQRCWCNN